jgi:hypothetical protein
LFRNEKQICSTFDDNVKIYSKSQALMMELVNQVRKKGHAAVPKKKVLLTTRCPAGALLTKLTQVFDINSGNFLL